MKTSQEINDMIRHFELDAKESPERTASRILYILKVMNERMEAIEATANKAANEASCIANARMEKP